MTQAEIVAEMNRYAGTMARPELFISDLKALRQRLADRLAQVSEVIKATKPEQAVRMAKLEGIWSCYHDTLIDLNETIGAWEAGCPAFRVTEELTEGKEA